MGRIKREREREGNYIDIKKETGSERKRERAIESERKKESEREL